MIGLDENTCAEKSIKRFLDQYELPLKVRKNTWFGHFILKLSELMQPEKLSEDASAEVTAMMNTPAPFMRCSVSMVRIQKKSI